MGHAYFGLWLKSRPDICARYNHVLTRSLPLVVTWEQWLANWTDGAVSTRYFGYIEEFAVGHHEIGNLAWIKSDKQSFALEQKRLDVPDAIHLLKLYASRTLL